MTGDSDEGAGKILAGDAPATGTIPILRSADLLGNAREIVIDHSGDLYRLRRTSKGKLILTK